ncbi:MAG: flagellar export protein FliJ [Deltaproteobacteria bacterium]|nr:flagellar export protein FliJ [Deltaproteobacteria bacterium]
MGFTFRFETLLKYRNHLKEKAGIELARARQQLNEAREFLLVLRGRFRESSTSFESRIRKGIASEEMKALYDYLAEMKRRIAAQETEVARRERVVKKKTEALLVRTKETRIMERLKEKDFQQWQGEQIQEERRIMNEVALVRHGKEFL